MPDEKILYADSEEKTGDLYVYYEGMNPREETRKYNTIKTFINDIFMNFLIKRDAITLRENAFNFDSIV